MMYDIQTMYACVCVCMHLGEAMHLFNGSCWGEKKMEEKKEKLPIIQASKSEGTWLHLKY